MLLSEQQRLSKIAVSAFLQQLTVAPEHAAMAQVIPALMRAKLRKFVAINEYQCCPTLHTTASQNSS